MEENVKVKAKFKGTSRRFEIRSTTTWEDLFNQIQCLFEIQDFHVKYCDDENELVSVSSQEELNEAIRLCIQKNKLLYLYIEDSSSQQTSDPSLLDLEERDVPKKDKPKNKSSSCYTDLASAMATELTALNSRLEKSTKKKESQETDKQNVQDEPQVPKKDKPKNKSSSSYGDLASTMASELTALNSRLEKSTKMKESQETDKQNVQDEPQVPKKDKPKNKSSSSYGDLASTMASELTALNSRLEKSTKMKESQETDKQNVQDEPQVKNDKKTKDSGVSCYTDLADAVAPDLAALNERISKWTVDDKESKKPANEPQATTSGTTAEPTASEAPKSCYVNLEDVMAQSKERESLDSQPSEQTDLTNKTAEEDPQSSSPNLGASRGWFSKFEQHQRQQGNGSTAPRKPKKKKKQTKKRGCYNELAETIAPELARLTVRENVAVQSESSDSASDNVEVVNKGNEMAKENMFDLKKPPVKVNPESKRQLDQSGDNNVKKPKRPRKHSAKKKGCYALMAEDIAPLFGAMNKRLEERQNIETGLELMAPPGTPTTPEQEVPLNTPSPDSVGNEPFVFVSHGDGHVSLEDVAGGGGELEMPRNPSYNDVADDVGPQRSLEQPSEWNQDVSSERNLISFDDERDVPQAPVGDSETMKVLMRKVLDESMDSIVNEAIHRLQTPNKKTPGPPCNTPQGQATPLGIVVHKGITCDSCGTEVHGIRYKCGNCNDFDLCETCEDIPGIHNMEHVFVKLRFPAAGIGRRHGEMVPIFKKSVYKKDCEKKQKERELRRAAKEAERERKRANKKQKHNQKAQEKERKKREKTRKTQERQEPRKVEISHVQERLQASFVSDASFPDGSIVSPGHKFMKTWVVQNDGDIAWNQWITLECIEGSIIGFPAVVPHLKPGASDVVSVEFVAPEVPGAYFSKWQLSYGLHTFGPHLWCEIQVPDQKDGESTIHHDQHTLIDTAFKAEMTKETDAKLVYETKLQATNLDDGSSSEYLSSEETPDTEPTMLSSSLEQKSEISSVVGPQRQDLEWDAGCAYDLEIVNVDPDDVTSQRETRLTDNWSIVDSEESDGEDSDSSLDEFTVLIPTCFDPDAPLTADPYLVLVTSIKEEMSHSFSSPFLNSMEPDLEHELIASEPSNLSNMERYTPDEESTPSKDTHPTDETASVLVKDNEVEEPKPVVITPSGRISPRGPSPQETVATETPVSRQPSMFPQGSIPLVTQPTTVTETRRYRSTTSDYDSDSNNVVTEVLNSAIEVVTQAGRAAFATVDNLFNGGVQATATYKPEDECEVTVKRPPSDFDAPPPPQVIWPSNRPATSPMDRLIEMGFGDRKLNQRVLHKHKDDLRATIEELLCSTENDWSSQRH